MPHKVPSDARAAAEASAKAALSYVSVTVDSLDETPPQLETDETYTLKVCVCVCARVCVCVCHRRDVHVEGVCVCVCVWCVCGVCGVVWGGGDHTTILAAPPFTYLQL
jgi:hypothetical protein